MFTVYNIYICMQKGRDKIHETTSNILYKVQYIVNLAQTFYYSLYLDWSQLVSLGKYNLTVIADQYSYSIHSF